MNSQTSYCFAYAFSFIIDINTNAQAKFEELQINEAIETSFTSFFDKEGLTVGFKPLSFDFVAHALFSLSKLNKDKLIVVRCVESDLHSITDTYFLNEKSTKVSFAHKKIVNHKSIIKKLRTQTEKSSIYV